jgi:hypothetical protein
MFALPTPDYEACEAFAPYFAKITKEMRQQALETFMPALQGRYIQQQRARQRQFDVRIGEGDKVLMALQSDGVLLHAIDEDSRRRIRAYAMPMAEALMARLDTLNRVKFGDINIPLEPAEHPRLFIEVEAALRACGALAAFSAYSGAELGLLRLSLQVNTERETRLSYGEIEETGVPKRRTTYFHVDSNDWPTVKALLFVSDVGEGQGPFRYVRGSHRLMNDFESAVRKTNDKLRQPREQFLALPEEFRQHCHFGDFIDETTPGAAELLAAEVVCTDGSSDLALFDNNGVHRGGFVRSGHRFMLQCQFWHAERMIERNTGVAVARAALQTA